MFRTTLFLALVITATITLTGCAPARFSAPPTKYAVPTALPDGTIKAGEGNNLAPLAQM